MVLWVCSMAFPAVSCAQGVAGEARTWFPTEYAPLWKVLDEADPERIRRFWAEDFHDHPIDMDPGIWENTNEQWQSAIEKYKGEGVAGSTVVQIQVEEISGNAVLIRTEWRDFGHDGTIEEQYRGTFVAGRFGSRWKFTNYFTVGCAPEQGLLISHMTPGNR
jgi:hypothetical protein